MSFTEDYNALRKIVERLERNDIPLEESIDLYSEGMSLLKTCRAFLRDAEQRVMVLMENGEIEKWKEADSNNE